MASLIAVTASAVSCQKPDDLPLFACTVLKSQALDTPSRVAEPLPRMAARGMRQQPESIQPVAGGPALVESPARSDGNFSIYRVGPDGVLSADSLGKAGLTNEWNVALGQDFKPATSLVSVSGRSSPQAPIVVQSHDESQALHFRFISSAGEEVMRCNWHPHSSREHAEWSASGREFLTTRTALKARLNGLSDPSDRYIQVYSAQSGKLILAERGADYTQDGEMVFIRLGTTLSAYRLADGQPVWESDVKTDLGDPRSGDVDPLFTTQGKIFIYARRAGLLVALDASTGSELWRRPLPGPVAAVHAWSEDRVLVQYAGGFLSVGPSGPEKTTETPSPADTPQQTLEDIVRTPHGSMGAVIDNRNRNHPELVVFGDLAPLNDQPQRFPIAGWHAQIALSDTVAYVLPWVPDGSQATLYAHDLTQNGKVLWKVPVPDRLTIPSSPGPAGSLHPFDHGIYGVDRSFGWVAEN